jgi:amino acid adenylation domain-containing protein
VPVGVSGELYIGGAGLARGYVGRPGLTAERFVANPYGGAGERMYRTGDLARWRSDGTIEFLGRSDFQVKIRGFRIELGEIEARLAEYPGVEQVAVLAREEEAGDKRLVAYYTGGLAGAEELRAHLQARLPDYMLPAAYVGLERLPLTPNGKLDRKALPAPEAGAYAARGYEAPRGEMETRLAALWAEVLQVERVGRQDHFFELGGHSLLAVALLARLRQQGLQADVRALFASPTLAGFAAAVEAQSGLVEVPPNRIPRDCERITPEMLSLVDLSPAEIERIVSGVPGGAANVQDIYPLAPLQEGILFQHLMAAEGDPYLLPLLLSFDSRGRLEDYLQALEAVIGRHDILRTAVVWEGLREPVQVVWRRAPLVVEEVAPEEAGGDVAGQLRARAERRQYRLDVRQAPLLRGVCVQDGGRWLLLLWSHHLAIDHTTLEVLQEEIQAHLRGAAGQLPAPLPFRNFVAQARLGVSRQEHEAFFRELLGDVEEPTAPFGLLDVQGDGRGIGEAQREVEAGLAWRLRQRARQLGVSAASLWHVAWAQVLARVTGREDVVFGTVLFGRMQGGEGAERVPGIFINTLPVRMRVGQEGVEASVRRTHGLLGELLRHEHAPLALAQRCSAVPAPAPLFSALLNYRYSRAEGQLSGGEALQAVQGMELLYAEERTNYPCTLSVDDWGEGFSLTAQVQAPIEPERVCELMHTALERLIEALERAPGRALRSLQVLPERERQRVLVEWNASRVEYARHECVHELFEAQAERTPEAVAVVYEASQLSYGELNRRANRVAHYLRQLGVGPDVPVGLCVERSLEMIVGLLGILKAGGAYVPLDPAYPAERLHFLLADARVAVLLSQRALRDRLPETDARRVELDGAGAAAMAQQPSHNPAVRLQATNLAYVIYTSGSTGKPKGVMNTHGGVVNRLLWMQQEYGIGVTDCILQKTPFGFDVSVWEFFWTLATGAKLIMAKPGGHKDPDYLAEQIVSQQVTTIHFVPSMLGVFLNAAEVDICKTLRLVFCSGEALGPELMRAYLRSGKGELHNLYGPTEAAVDVTYWRCTDEPAATTVPIGRPIANTQIYILDAECQPVPVGVSGELYIGGAGLARGYVGRPGLTAERFVANPYGGAGERMYRTGDLARWRSDGTIEFLGRSDFQVKIRGFRIELGEIEARLAEYPGVEQVAVLAREEEAGDKRLVAYYTWWAGERGEELRAHLQARCRIIWCRRPMWGWSGCR